MASAGSNGLYRNGQIGDTSCQNIALNAFLNPVYIRKKYKSSLLIHFVSQNEIAEMNVLR